eukprot:TRINITY_DN77449_c0_g1_i1.p1 TRINITY_DN77449_c0_g1~~TRINITY_DN77449_c0_g1_i1.p1  ORF type:complete len:380 (+),score=90.01 TRINITY_DN77449_c0_g1_i1:73-1212(+)
MIGDNDPRVKKLQEIAWGLQNVTNKPMSRLPEDAKRSAYRVTSRAIALCSNAEYVEEEDFVTRAAQLTKEVEAKRKELEELEEAVKADIGGKCFRRTADGGYAVGQKSGGASQASDKEFASWSTTTLSKGSSTNPALTAKEIAARCADDPEALWLGSTGMHDSDVEALLEGLRRSGSQLTALDLSHNDLADAGIQKLVTGLASGLCPNLAELWLGGNAFGELGAQILSGGLAALRKDLSINLVSDSDSRDADRQADSNVSSARTANSAPAARPEAREDRTPPEERRNSSSGGAHHEVEPKQSSVEIDVSDGKLQARVSMPSTVNSAADFELDISDERLVVRAGGNTVADERLPRMVDPETAQAKFSRKTHVLTVTLEIR